MPDCELVLGPVSASEPNRMKLGGELCSAGTCVTVVRPVLRERFEVSRGDAYDWTVN
jgi:hypothetical protein